MKKIRVIWSVSRFAKKRFSTLKIANFAALIFVFGGFFQAVSAQTYDCERTRMSTSGFTSQAAAASWFHETVTLKVDGSRAFSSRYGEGVAEDLGKRLKLSFDETSAAGTKVIITYTIIKKNNRYIQKHISPSGFSQSPGAGGKCQLRG
ncbi:MAG: hypothetical protein AAGD04_07295 [Pseudomonadota bacterium]